ncbi:MAG: DUF983 domain-containing protein [Microthrixaceae bacterium]
MPSPQPRRKPKLVVPTTVQLGLSPRKMLLRGTVGRCPVCGNRKIFHRWFSMDERCSNCSLHFERVEGHWIGAIGVNTVVITAAMLLLLMGVTLLLFPDPIPQVLILVELAIAGFGPLLFFPASRTLWSAIDLLMRPLNFGEVDPRYVIVDPDRDRPKKGP